MKAENKNIEASKKEDSKFVKAIKFIFVKNIGYKAFAVVLSIAVWILTVGLG